MNMIKKLITRANILFIVVLAIVLFFPTERSTESPVALIVVVLLTELLYLISYLRTGKKSSTDIACAAYILIGFWDVAAKLNLTHPVLVPPPENVFYVFISQRELIIQGLFSSLSLLVWGFAIALFLGIFLGLMVGWIPRLRQAVYPIAKVISPIPPLVYTPYVVALMPTFKLASIFVIFSGIFWPTFMNMINRVGSMDKKLIDSAKVMNVSTGTMLFRVILPYTMPGIMSGLSVSLATSFMCLTGAELLGASSGLGYFVKKFSDYADYTKVIAGIIIIGIVVTILNLLVQQIEQRTIKWKY